MIGQLRPERALAVLGALLVALTLYGISFRPHEGGPIALPHDMAATALLVCAAGLLYLAAVAIVLRSTLPRSTLWGILACGLLLRVLLLATPPFLSTDIYRYVWDGRTQAAGINPYRYVPADPALAPLRDSDIYPHINRPATATTIYPPVAQAIFLAVAQASPTLTAMKAAMALFEGLAVLVLLHLLPRAGLPSERVLIYLWHPLPAWEIAGNGHVDGAAIAFVALALLACSYRRPALTGLALGCATLVKLLPLCLAPALWQRWDWRLPAMLALVAMLGYLPYLGVGAGVLGFLPGYAREASQGTGIGYYPLYVLSLVTDLSPAAVPLYLGFGLAVLAALAWQIAFRDRAADLQPATAVYRDCLLLSTGLIVLLTPPYPWYFAWLLLFSCFVPRAAVLCLTVASFLVYLAFFDPNRYAQAVMYGLFWGLLAISLLRRAGSIAQPAFFARERS